MSAGLTIAEEDPRAPDVLAMIAALDARMRELYAAPSCHLTAADDLVAQRAVFLVARLDGVAAGCGAVVPDVDGAGEVKRMWTDPAYRGRGIARAILRTLEARARALGLPALRLETGPAQPEALALYESEGFARRGAFGGYGAGDPNSIFYEKHLLGAPVAVAEDDPRSPESAAMFAALDAEMRALYGDVVDGWRILDPDSLAGLGGVFVMARIDGRPAGCGALTPLGPDAAEIKRMWTAPEARGRGVARAVIEALEARGRAAGYAALYLESGPKQPAALRLYARLGFLEVPPYYGRTPDPGTTVFMRKLLSAEHARPVAESAA